MVINCVRCSEEITVPYRARAYALDWNDWQRTGGKNNDTVKLSLCPQCSKSSRDFLKGLVLISSFREEL